MKYLKYYEALNRDINSICKKYKITNYTINSDGYIDVDGDVDLSHEYLTKLPLKFGKVSGNFECFHNKLSSLEFCPTHVGGGFNCNDNNLKSLQFGPSSVGGDYYCSYNQLTNLEYYPTSLSEGFYCDDNPVYEIWKLFDDYMFLTSVPKVDYSEIELFNDYDIIRGDSIVLDRFNEFLEVIGQPPVKGVEGYKNI